ncbi:glycosyltransferase family 2 protein [Neobacillus sp.]|uniref:glycosyltransferase family 2 protein n=1 Tax=Neobacillus sp. TaxID=2675273 RepID=UPI00289A5426|nr:glycosyltransferase family 2 protein [Neobacillus sp.]
MDERRKAPAISIITYAYNVENYIRECVESVLDQTFSDFEWVILDNGCTDRTSGILEEYANTDNRIRLFRNQNNSFLHNGPLNPDFVYYGENLASEYWCMVDSDDFLHADFLKELYQAAKKYDADIAVGGTEMFMDENVQMRGTRCPPDFYSEDITSLGDMFPQIYGCFRPIWGKLFKVSIVKKQQEYRKQSPLNLTNGGDTVFNLDCLRFANSVVGINKVLHYYRIRKTSYYHTQVDTIRYLDYKIIYDESKMLLQRWNKLNTETLNYITHVLYASIKDCIDIAANAESNPPKERIAVIETICNDSFVFRTLDQNGLTGNLFLDTQKAIERIMKNVSEDDFPILINHYMYRLFTSIKIINLPLANLQDKQNAFLLYLSSLCDELNKNKFGAVLLYGFFRAMGRTDLEKFEKEGLMSEFLASNPALLRELVNSRVAHAVLICEEHSGERNYDLLKEELLRKRKQMGKSKDYENEFFRKHLPDKKIVEVIERMVTVFDQAPLDKDALCYKLYLHTLRGEIRSALETALILSVFYSDDSSAMIAVGYTFACEGQKDRAKEILEKAIDLCVDESKRLEITKLMESLL